VTIPHPQTRPEDDFALDQSALGPSPGAAEGSPMGPEGGEVMVEEENKKKKYGKIEEKKKSWGVR